MRTKLAKIGNSRGVRFPKAFIEEAGLTDDLEITAREGVLEVRAVRKIRAGWTEDAKQMAEIGEDRLLDSNVPTRFDLEEWEW
jgi:antitoxin MazE